MQRIQEPRTHAERLLARYFVARGWAAGAQWQYEPRFEGRRRRPDFRLVLGGWKLMLEVKEFGRAESAEDGPRRGAHARISSKIHLAQRQLREFRRDHLCAAVLRSGEDADADVSDPAVTMGALLRDRRGRVDDPPVAAVLVVSERGDAVAVTVIEHPLASPAFPSHLFQGPWDAHWALGDEGPERVFAGAALCAGEAIAASPSAA